MRWSGTKEIKVFVKNWLTENRADLLGKTVVDIPAGNGHSTQMLLDVGAKVKAFDLFPEFFKVPGHQCEFADLGERIPCADESVDFVLCQEGIEHISDPIKAFSEFNRVLRTGGKLIITTPNYSNLRSRLSYMLTESEYFGKIAAPNELDSIWFTSEKKSATPKLYFGHVFLIGMQRLRLFARISGFEKQVLYPTRVNTTSAMLFLFYYPLVWLFNLQSYFRMKRHHPQADGAIAKAVFQQGTSLQILLDNHLFVIFQKTSSVESCQKALQQDKASDSFIT